MKTFIIIIGLLIACLTASANTYYIDYAGGNDINSGTSTGAPWQYCPAMQPFSGTYTHSAGDRFIFKGGVTWPNSALPLYITTSGTSGSHDYYGVDKTWFSGASWSRPTFDGENTNFVNWSGNRDNVIWCKTVNYVDIDNIEAKNFVWRSIIPTSNSDSWSVYFDTCTNCTVMNFYSHDWLVTATNDDKFGGFGAFASSGTMASNCVVTGPSTIAASATNAWTPPDWTGSGAGAFQINTVTRCDFSRVSEGMFSGSLGTYNYIHDGGQSYDAKDDQSSNGLHENGIYPFGSGTFYGNIFSNWVSGITAYAVPCWNGANGTVKYYNNLFINCSPNGITIDPEGNASSNNGAVYLLNNTVVGSSYPWRIVLRTGTPTVHTVVCSNELYIGTTTPNIGDLPPDFRTNYLTITTSDATADNLTLANSYEPQSQIAAIYDQGVDVSSYGVTNDILGVSRPQGSAWDIGAYEYVSAPDAGGGIATTGNIFARRRYR